MRGHDIATRLCELGQANFTSQPLLYLDREALDSFERERLRQLIRGYRGDQSLLGPADTEFDAALGLTCKRDGIIAAPTP